MAQANLMDSAIEKAQDAEPYEIVNFVIRLDDAVLPESEIATLHQFGMTDYLPFIRQVLVAIPAS
jgi:hypothetical protein